MSIIFIVNLLVMPAIWFCWRLFVLVPNRRELKRSQSSQNLLVSITRLEHETDVGLYWIWDRLDEIKPKYSGSHRTDTYGYSYERFECIVCGNKTRSKDGYASYNGRPRDSKHLFCNSCLDVWNSRPSQQIENVY